VALSVMLRRTATAGLLSMGIVVSALAGSASAATITYTDAYHYAAVTTDGGSGRSVTFVDARDPDFQPIHGVEFLNKTSGSSLVKVTIYMKECTSNSTSSCGSPVSQTYEEYVLSSQLKKFTIRGYTMTSGRYYLSCSSVESSDGFKIVNQCANLMKF
jgi:hypothetical protein